MNPTEALEAIAKLEVGVEAEDVKYVQASLFLKARKIARETLAAQQSVQADGANEPLCICGKPLNRHNGVACLPETPRR